LSHSDDITRLRHILDASRRAISILNDRSLEELAADESDDLALERCLEIIGEAANRVGPSTPAELPALPWRDMIGMSQFMLQATLRAAEEVLADQTLFVLPAEEWDRFVALLDRPPRVLPSLKEAASKPSPFGRP
jgi:uncharacterized protein with HEPN domain